MSRIISIGTAVPKYGTDQLAILEFMQAAYKDALVSRKLKYLFHHSGISKRHSVIPDFGKSQSENILFEINRSLPSVEKRMEVFKKQALLLSLEAIQNAFGSIITTVKKFGITHLITVTCTGIYAPGIDTEIVERLNLPNDIYRTSVNFMGCNAAFPALKIADMIAQSDENAKVLIVCVELCTLHFQPKDNNDNLLSNTIFGDGSAAVIVTSDIYADQHRHSGLNMKGFYSILLNRGKDLMGWNVTPVNFEMNLDARLAEFIREELDYIVLKAGNKLNIRSENIDKWAVHPGGKKILDSIKRQLHLNDADLQYSYKILNSYGNMSSPTILFVLNEIMKTKLKPDETIFSVGFGPGLSIETALFMHVS